MDDVNDVQVMPESGIDPASVRQMFKAAFLKVELEDDGDLRVHTEAGPKVIITVDDERKLLKYMAIFGLKPDASEELKHAFINTLNDKVILVRFSVPREDVLMADYFLPFEEGVLPFHVVNAARMLGRITVGALAEFDVDDLLE